MDEREPYVSPLGIVKRQPSLVVPRNLKPGYGSARWMLQENCGLLQVVRPILAGSWHGILPRNLTIVEVTHRKVPYIRNYRYRVAVFDRDRA